VFVTLFALLFAAGQCAGIESPSSAPAMKQRSYSTGVPIVQGGVGCTIIRPADRGPWHDLADSIARELRRLGAREVRVLNDTDVIPNRLDPLPPALADQPLILLGDLESNRAFFPFYANYYTYCDADYPGQDGYVVQTVVRPFGNKTNCLIVGASSIDGARAGVERLIQRLAALPPGENVELPYCQDVKLGARLEAIIEPIVASALEQDGGPPPIGSDGSSTRASGPAGLPADAIEYGTARDRFTSYAHLYFYTGRDDLAQRARDWGVYLAHRGEPGEKGIRIADYTMENLAAAWRRVSPAPVFKPQQRQLIDTRMYETIEKNATAWWRQKGAIPEIGGRHHTTGMLAWWTLIRCMLELSEPNDAARTQLQEWRTEAEGYLDGLLRHYWDDLDDYQSADSAQIAASYALQTGRLEWFNNGLARRAAQKLLALTDNRGWYVGVQGYGEAIPGWERFTLNGGLLLGACAFVYDDNSYDWLLQRFPTLSSSWGALQPWGLHQYATNKTKGAAAPAWLTGMQVLRLTPYRFDLLTKGTFLNSPLMDGFAVAGLRVPSIDSERAFDKVIFRSSSQPDGAFLLLQGMSGIALSTIDMNSIIRYTDQGRIWLIHNTGRMSLFFKNAVYVSNGLNDEPVPAACELLAQAESDTVSMASSRLADYRGTDWTRNVLFCGERFTVVIDQVEVRKPGSYVVSCAWRTPGWAELEADRWTARQDDVTFHVVPGELTGMTSERFTSGDGATRPTVLRQNRHIDARPGDSVVLENLLYTASPRREQVCDVRRVAPGALAIRVATPAEEQYFLAFAHSNGLDLPGIGSDARAGLIAPDGITLSDATYITIGDHRERREDRGSLHVKLDAATQSDVISLVRELFASSDRSETATLATTPPADNHGTSLATLWANDGPATRGKLVDGIEITSAPNLHGLSLLTTDWMLPTLVAEPKLSPQGGSGLTFETPKHIGGRDAGRTTLEPLLDPLAGSEFTITLPRSLTVSEIELTGRTAGSITTPMPPARLDVELTFDAPGTPERTRKLTLDRETHYHNLYKGHAYAFETYRARDLNEPASSIRVRVLGGPDASMPLNDVRVRATDDGFQPVQVRAMDLDGDGHDELLCWAKHGEFALLDATGRQRWRRDFATDILAVDAWDIDASSDNPATRTREIFVSLQDWRVIVLNLDGSVRWQVNWGDMKRKTDGKFYSDGSLVYGMVAWQPDDAAEKEVLLTSYYFAATLDPRGNLRECFRRSGHHTQIREVPPGLPGAGGLVTRSDIPWTGPVPLEWLDPRTGKVVTSVNVPNGPAVLVEVDDFDGDGQAEAIVATEQGIGLYSANAPQRRWEQLAEAALTGAAVVPGSMQQPIRFAYGRQDGYCFALGIDGRVLAQKLFDEPIRSLAALMAQDGTPLAVVATGTALRCVRLTDLTEVHRLPGQFQLVTAARTGSGRIVVAVRCSGEVVALGL